MRFGRNHPWGEIETQVDRRSDDATVSRPRLAEDGSPRSAMDSHYPYMFVEDVRNHIFPVGGELRKGRETVATFAVETGDAEQVEELATFAFATHHAYNSRHFAAAFVEWARDCVYWLLRNGEVWYELAYARTEKPAQAVGFRVFTIHSGRIARRHRFWGEYVQQLPREGGAPRSSNVRWPREGNGSVISLGDDSRIFEVVPDRDSSPFRDAAVELAGVGSEAIPAFMMPGVPAEQSRVPYDFQSFRRTEACAVASATRRVGWSARGTFGDYETEYYSLARRLRFERALVPLRGLLFASANRMLARAGQELKFRASVSPRGLVTPAELDELSVALERGDIGARALLDRLSFYK